MRKLMVSTIIILPLLLLAILLVSGAILSLSVHIYVDDIEFKNEDAIVLVMEDLENPPTFDLHDEYTVFPKIATNKDIRFFVDDDNLLNVNEEGVLTARFYGETNVNVQSKENVGAIATKRVIITGSTIQQMKKNEFSAEMKIGDRQQLSVSISPIDALNKGIKWESSNPNAVKVNGNGTITAVGVGEATIKATAVATLDSKTPLTQEFAITSKDTTAGKFSVFCDGKLLENNGSYKTLSDQLNLTVVNANNVSYQINDNGAYTSASNGVLSIEDMSNVHSITIKNGGETIKFNVSKAELEDFGMTAFATIDSLKDASVQEIKTVESIKSEETDIHLSKYVQDSFTLKLLTNEDYIGGFGTEQGFEDLIKLEVKDTNDWEIEYDALNMQIILSFANRQDFEKVVTLTYNDTTFNINLVRFSLADISFIGYDSNNDEDVHKGFQQIRVFAKHSWYNGQRMNYYTLPFKTSKDLTQEENESVSNDSLTWNLTRFVGNESDGITTTQLGKTVTYTDKTSTKTYTIVKDEDLNAYVLQDENGNTVSGPNISNAEGNKIFWVDTYSEDGKARIYFGDFDGLLESDIQNDYFGNFDCNDNYVQPTQIVDDGTGRDFTIHNGNSFTFLKIEAGDGAVGGKSCFFNFNILDDDEAINIFEKTGYYAPENKRLVLQTNLYGPSGYVDGEGSQFTAKYEYDEELTLDKPDVGKAPTGDGDSIDNYAIYGNGYQINCDARNHELKLQMGDTYNTTVVGATFGKLYNCTLLGCNPVDKIESKNVKMYFQFPSAYYSEIKYYIKLNPNVGQGNFYLKNSTLGFSGQALLLYYGEKVYLENVVFLNTLSSIYYLQGSGCPLGEVYFKGSTEFLNYHSVTDFAAGCDNFASSIIAAKFELFHCLEWFGKHKDLNDPDKGFLNPILVSMMLWAQPKMYAWDGQQYQAFDNSQYYNTDPAYDRDNVLELEDGQGGIRRALAYMELVYGFTYAGDSTDDGGPALDWGKKDANKMNNAVGDRDMSQLFSNKKYIRLLCQYKGFDENGKLIENTQHMQWHMQQIYRNSEKLKNRENDHMQDLKNSLKGMTWDNGTTGVDDQGNPYDKTVEANNTLAYAILPKKEEF